MKPRLLFINILTFVLLLSCSNDPVPIKYGKDACGLCRMTIVQQGFGTEIVTRKGKVLTFDSVECMLRFYFSKGNNSKDFASVMVTDALTPGKLIDARKAYYLQSEKYPSPMGENLSAYESSQACDKQFAEFGGTRMDWQAVCKLFQR